MRFIGQVADDQFGNVFAHDIRAGGIGFDTPVRNGEPATAQCLIFVTPDGQRTMNTFLGASQFLPADALDEAVIADSRVLYLEGYLWDPEEPRRAMRRAIAAARGAGREVAFTMSDAFVIARHGDDFRALIAEGQIDILFANEHELAALTGLEDFHEGLTSLPPRCPVSSSPAAKRRPCRPSRRNRPCPGPAHRGRGRHHRRGRSVCRRFPVRPCARHGSGKVPDAGRDLRGRGDFALWRASRSRSQGADGFGHRLTKYGRKSPFQKSEKISPRP
jgi:hypothetical protein